MIKNRRFPEDDEKRWPLKGEFWKGFVDCVLEFFVILVLVTIIIYAVFILFPEPK